ncbi:MAG: polysaccharide pyruvyl transferase family protein, partial [Bacillota bacterium]|nr:polysaccharide pyruvyl transferase family protein [Bacillota bacterium]
AFDKLGKVYIEKKQLKNFDACVYIGGSLFMENPSDSRDEIKLRLETDYFYSHNKPYLILSSNFGPFKSGDYVKRYGEIFKKCTDVSFRDKYSYELFSNISSVRYAPDAVFSYPLPSVSKKSGTFGISVIDLRGRGELSAKWNDYLKAVCASIVLEANAGRAVTLFGFCEREGDFDTVNEVILTLDRNIAEKVKAVYYTGDMNEFISEYLSMERTVCSRFHAMLLSYMADQPFFPVVYSKKMLNIINDLNLCQNYADLNSDTLPSIFIPEKSQSNNGISKQPLGIFHEMDKLVNTLLT